MQNEVDPKAQKHSLNTQHIIVSIIDHVKVSLFPYSFHIFCVTHLYDQPSPIGPHNKYSPQIPHDHQANDNYVYKIPFNSNLTLKNCLCFLTINRNRTNQFVSLPPSLSLCTFSFSSFP